MSQRQENAKETVFVPSISKTDQKQVKRKNSIVSLSGSLSPMYLLYLSIPSSVDFDEGRRRII